MRITPTSWTRALTASALLLAGSGAASAGGTNHEPTGFSGPKWAADGFAAPESVLFDGARDRLIVSNVAGKPTATDGEGYLSLVSTAGEIIERRWVVGLDAPKGMALAGDTLYVADITRVHAVDVTSGTVERTYTASDAKFLNDVAAHGEQVYISDMLTNRLYRIADGELSTWIDDSALEHPNGLLVQGHNLIVASWGPGMQSDFSTEQPGSLRTVSIEHGRVADERVTARLGNLDGLVAVGNGHVVTDWIAGKAMALDASGARVASRDLPSGSADLGTSGTRVYIPLMKSGKVVAYDVSVEAHGH